MCGLDVALLKKCNVPLLWNKCSAFFVLSILFFWPVLLCFRNPCLQVMECLAMQKKHQPYS